MRHLLFAVALLCTAALLCSARPARAWEGAPVLRTSYARLELAADLQNLFKFRNDADFDRTRPFYDESGQTIGAFATVFKPRVGLLILERLRIIYELELGLNYWSMNNPDQQLAIASDIFVMKHREVYGEGELLGKRLGFRAGYSHFREPTGLFLAHWIGNAQVWAAPTRRLRTGLFLGQVPDQVFEGIVVSENGFRRDIWVFGGAAESPLTGWLQLQAAVTALVDTHLVGQARMLACPSVHLQAERGRWSGFLDGALQAGRLKGHALDGGDETHVAWALQGGARWRGGRFDVGANLLLLSPDDAYEGNGRSHAFLYSGKSRSSTLLLTEDELRDWYDNYDERMSRFSGGFFQNAAGLMVADVRGTWDLHRYLRPSLIVGVASVLNSRNALGGKLVGVETDLLLELPFHEHFIAHVVGSLLVPGAAGAALVNRIDRDAKGPQGQVQASLLVRY